MSDSCDPLDCSLPGSSVHGILQARILEWVAISFFRGSSWPWYWTRSPHCRQVLYQLSYRWSPNIIVTINVLLCNMSDRVTSPMYTFLYTKFGRKKQLWKCIHIISEQWNYILKNVLLFSIQNAFAFHWLLLKLWNKTVQGTQVQFLDPEDPLKKAMATHSSILACLENPMGIGAWRATVYGYKELDTAEH